MNFVNEVYFGDEVEGIKQLQSQLSEIRIKCKNIDIVDEGRWNKFSTSKPVSDFNRQMESVFGFKTFSLAFELSESLNAWTVPISSKMDTENNNIKYIESTKNGFKYKKEAGYNVMVAITTKLLLSTKFTDREVMAIILHELGHNFSSGINGAATVFGVLNKFAQIPFVIMSCITALYNPTKAMEDQEYIFNDEDNLVNNLAKTVEKKTGVSKVMFTSIGIFLLLGATTIDVLINYTYLVLIKIFNRFTPWEIIRNLLGYNDERVADNFPTMYGYGKDISSALVKIDKMSDANILKRVNNSSILYNMLMLLSAPIMLMFAFLEPHPRDLTRVNNQLNILKLELKKTNIDAKMKAQIEQDIKDTEKLLSKASNVPEPSNPLFFKKVYRLFLLKMFGGNKREVLFNDKNTVNQYDDIYNSSLKR